MKCICNNGYKYIKNLIKAVFRNKRAFLVFILQLLIVNFVAAKGLESKEALKISAKLGDYYSGVSALVKAISLVLIYIGSFKVYWKMQHGDRDVSKTIIMIVGGCVALTTMITLFPLIFTSRG